MIKISILYPNIDEKSFDFDYYCKHHMPMIKARLGDACISIAAEKGICGAMPGSQPKYAAMGHLFFESLEAYQASFGPHAKVIMDDMLNYTDIRPAIQISEVLGIQSWCRRVSPYLFEIKGIMYAKFHL